MNVVFPHIRPWTGTRAFLSAGTALHLFLAGTALAGEIIPADTDTYKYVAPNGVPVVNIARPNGRGLSHNHYTEFSVNSEGAVLNNTRNIEQSTLAGAIRGNPNILPGYEASIILNEVTSARRSRLNGYIEVNGKTADVVIANPWGITTNGLGFINTNRATLTTGVPVITGAGALNGFTVKRGDLVVEGAGIDATGQDYLDLVVRSARFGDDVDGKGQVNAKNLHLTTGANTWDYDTRAATRIAGTGDAPSLAIDSRAFGGMYANRITIVATEAGVGVRALGDMAASAEDLRITASGSLQLKNTMSAEKKVAITYDGDASGKVEISGADASMAAKTDIVVDGGVGAVEVSGATFKANQDLTITAASLTDSGDTDNTRAAGNDITLTTTGTTAIDGTKWVAGNNVTASNAGFTVGANGAEIYSGTDGDKTGQSIAITASSGDIALNTAKMASADDITVTATTGAIAITSGGTQDIEAQDSILFSAATTIGNSGEVLAANHLTVRSTATSGTVALTNSGRLQATAGTLDLAASSGTSVLSITNQSGGILAAGDILTVTATGFANQSGGTIQGTNGSTIDVANTLDNDGTLIVSNTANKDATLNVGTLDNAGTLQGRNNVAINVANLDGLTNSGDVLVTNNLVVRSTNSGGDLQLTNSGWMQAGGTLDLAGYGGGNTLDVSNTGTGTLLATVLTVKADTVTNAAGAAIQGTNGTTLNLTGNLDNDGIFVASNNGSYDATFTVGGSVDNSGTISSLGDIGLTASQGLTNTGTVIASSDLTITNSDSYGVTNDGGILQAGNALSITTGSSGSEKIDNKSGAKIIGANITLTAPTLDNSAIIDGTEFASLDLTSLTNSGTLILSDSGYTSDSTVQAQTISNSGTFQGEGTVALTLKNSGTLTNTASGKMLSSAGSLRVRSGASSGTASISNSGTIQFANGIDIQGYNDGTNISLTNASGAVVKGGNVRIKGTTIGNSGTIQNDSDSGALDIDVGTFTNSGSSSLLINSGTNWSTLDATTVVNQGAIHGNGNFTINAGSLSNSNTAGLSSLTTLTLTTTSDFDNYGALYAGNTLSLTATGRTITNRADATMDSGGSMTVSTGTFTNYSDINASGDITINTTVAFNNLMTVTGGTMTDLVEDYRGMTQSEMAIYDDQTGGDHEVIFWDGDSSSYYFNTSVGFGSIGQRVSSSSNPADDNWSVYQYYGDYYEIGTWPWNDGAFRYKLVKGQKKISTTNVLSDGATVTKATIAAGGTLTINIGSGDGSNDGSILSAATVNINGSGDFTNNARASEETIEYALYGYYVNVYDDDDDGPDKHYIQTLQQDGSHTYKTYEDDGNWTTVAGEATARSYAKSHMEDRGTEQLSAIGAGIFANTLNINLTGDFTNVGSTVDSNAGDPSGASPGSLSKSGSSDASLADGATGATNASGTSGKSPVGGVSFPGLDLSLPTNPNGYFVANKSSDARYLVEVNPRFGLEAEYLGSDYLEKKLEELCAASVANPSCPAPDKVSKHLGDSTYETQLIKKQIQAQTGRDILQKYQQNTAAQTKALFDNAAQVAGDMKLSYGVALTADQVKNLKTDIVWMVKQVVEGQEVLAPVVYLARATTENLNAGSAQVVASNTSIEANTLTNTGGVIEGGTQLALNTVGDITNTAGTLRGGDVSLTSAQGSIVNETLATQRGGANADTRFSKTAGIEATGNLAFDAGKDIVSTGAKIKAGDNADLKAGGDVELLNLEDRSRSFSSSYTNYGAGSRSTSTRTETVTSVGSTLDVGGNLKVDAGKSLTGVGADINVGGNADLKTGKDISLTAAQEYTTTTTKTETSVGGQKIGFFSAPSVTKTTVSTRSQTTARGSTLNVGGSLKADAGRDINVVGSDVDVKGSGNLKAGRDINVTTAEESSYQGTTSVTSVSLGLFGIGDSTHSKEQSVTQFTNKKSMVNFGGDVAANAGNDINIIGSDVDIKGAADLQAGNDVVVAAAQNRTITVDKKSQDFGFVGSIVGGLNKSKSETVDRTTNRGSTTDVGANLTVGAKRDVVVYGSDIEAGGDVDIDAGRDQLVLAAEDKTVTTTVETVDKGFSFYAETAHSDDTSSTTGQAGANVQRAGYEGKSGWAGAGIQREMETTTTVRTQTEAATSSIKSGGSITRTAGNALVDQGTQIEAAKDYSQQAKTIANLAAENTDTTTSTTTNTLMRFGVFAEGSVEQNATSNAKAIADKGKSMSDKGQTLADGDSGAGDKAGAYLGARAQGATAAQDVKNLLSSEGEAGGEAGFEQRNKVTITTETTSSSTAVASNIKVGGNFSSTSSGTTEFQGTNVDAGGNIDIAAAELKVTAAEDTTRHTTDTQTHESYTRLGADVSGSANMGDGETDQSAAAKLEAGYRYGTETATETTSTAVVSSFTSGGGLNVKTTNDATFEGTKIKAGDGASIDAGGDVAFNAAKDTTSSDTDAWSVGGYGKVTYDGGWGGGGGASGTFKNDESGTSSAQVASIDTGSGGLSITSGKDVTLEGTKASGQGALDIDAAGDVNVTAATNTASRDYVDVSTRIDGEADAKDYKLEGAIGIKGEKSSGHEETGGNLAFGSGVNVSAGKDLTMVGTNVDGGGGDVNLSAGGDVDLKAAESDSSSFAGQASGKLGYGSKKGLDGSFEATGEISGSHTEDGVNIRSGGDLNIASGGKTTLEGTDARVDGDATIDAKGGVDKQNTENYGGTISGGVTNSGYNLADANATFNVEQTTIQAGGKEKTKAPKDVEDKMSKVKALMKEGKTRDQALRSMGIDGATFKEWTGKYGDLTASK